MAANTDIIGTTTEPLSFTYDANRAMLYALGIGATAAELDYLYERRGPKVFPTFAVIPAYDALMAVMARSDISFENVVHGHQKVSVSRPLPPAATLLTTATVSAVYDMKKMAQVVITTRSHTAEGEHLFDTEWGILVLNSGGFGGEPPPAREGGAPARAPDAVVAGGDATRLKEIGARFTKPVWPGDTLRTEVWNDGDKVWFRTSTRERGDAVLSHGTARLT